MFQQFQKMDQIATEAKTVIKYPFGAESFHKVQQPSPAWPRKTWTSPNIREKKWEADGRI